MKEVKVALLGFGGIAKSHKKGYDLLAAEIQKAVDLGLDCCQLSVWDNSLCLDEEFTAYVKRCFDRDDFYSSALWAGWTKPCEWNFTAGPVTIGLVPHAYRFQRLQELMNASDFVEKLGVRDMITHVGFIPENPDDPNFSGVVSALRHLCKYMQKKRDRGSSLRRDRTRPLPCFVPSKPSEPTIWV